ncbi:MAG: alpha/beta fold hydrolase [Flavobacteriaceae bacterium]|nr:alpha/beta fold hydrolase [Flavobacteriaceae bacterium]
MKLYATIIGEGKPIVILHGLYGSSDNWFTIGKALAEKGFAVHLIDQRNHGRSPHSDEHNYTALVADLKEYLTDHNLTEIALLGHSMGGKTAMLFTLTYPEIVKKLIVVDIAPKFYPKNYDNHLYILDTMLKVNLAKASTRKDIAKMLTPYIKKKSVVQLIMKNLSRDKVNNFEWKINIKALAQNLDDITGGTDGWDNKNCTVPALFLRGENSDYLSLEDDFLIKKSFKNMELTTIPNAGHWVHAEQPELVLKTILYFVE